MSTSEEEESESSWVVVVGVAVLGSFRLGMVMWLREMYGSNLMLLMLDCL